MQKLNNCHLEVKIIKIPSDLEIWGITPNFLLRPNIAYWTLFSGFYFLYFYFYLLFLFFWFFWRSTPIFYFYENLNLNYEGAKWSVYTGSFRTNNSSHCSTIALFVQDQTIFDIFSSFFRLLVLALSESIYYIFYSILKCITNHPSNSFSFLLRLWFFFFIHAILRSLSNQAVNLKIPSYDILFFL